jgi:predicted acyl esterase
VTQLQASLDRPWRRPGALRYAVQRLAGIVSPPVTVVEPHTPLVIDRDVPVSVRDGTVLRVNCYRPVTDEPVPVIMCAHPYGKDRLPSRRGRRSRFSFQYRMLRQPGPVTFSTLTGWEAYLWDGNRYVPFEGSYGFGRDRITTGWQRISLRSPSPGQPPDFTTPRLLRPGDISNVTIDLGPSATQFSAGQAIRLVIAGRWLWPRNPLSGQFPAAYQSLRAGRCTVHWGPDRPSRLTIPVIPPPS